MGSNFFFSLFALMLALPTSSAAADNSVSFEHGDWMLACDNTRTCRAAGYQADGDDHPPVSVLLTRLGGPHQRVTAELTLGNWGDVVTPASLRLRINGQDLGPLSSNTADEPAKLTAPQVAALLKALTRDSEILAVGNDKQQWAISDQGASAVLLKMDEFQGRLGTPGALMRKGERGEDTVPPAVPTPKVKAAALAATRPADGKLAESPDLLAALQHATKRDDCEGLSADKQDKLTVQRLSSDKLLVSTQCWMAAYNVGYGYWVINDHAPYQPMLVTTSASEDSGGMITSEQKGRGLGDCWGSQDWTWDGRRFVHTGESTTGMCKLVTPGGPWVMPTLVTDVQTP